MLGGRAKGYARVPVDEPNAVELQDTSAPPPYETALGENSAVSIDIENEQQPPVPNEGGVAINLLSHDPSVARKGFGVDLNWTLGELKQRAYPQELSDKRSVRFIMMGKVLTDDGASLSSLGLNDSSFLHVVVSAPKPAEEQNNDEDNQNHEEGVWVMDRRFNNNAFVDDDEPHIQREGTRNEFFLGFVIGFVLGFLALIWVWHRGVSRKQKLGLLTGMGCSLALNIMHMQMDSDKKDAAVDGMNITNETTDSAT